MHKFILLIITICLSITVFAQKSNRFEVNIKKTGTLAGTDESSDDAEQENDVMDKLFDDDLDMGWEGDDFNILSTGLRFTNIEIPQGAKIDSAYLEIYAHEAELDTAKVTIYGEAADNAVTFDMDNLILKRPKTIASYNWVVTEKWKIWTKYRTPDITPIIQEIVDRQGWKNGNALALVFKGQDQGASNKDNARDFMSFENEEDPADGGDGKNHPERVPKLVIYYTSKTNATNDLKVNSFDVYPNPIEISFHITRSLDPQSTVKLMNMHGVCVREYPSNLDVFSTLDITPGFYSITASKNGVVSTKKIIVR